MLLSQERGRPERRLKELDCLLGVYDGTAWAGFASASMAGPILDDHTELASPPCTSLRELEQASLGIERDGGDADQLRRVVTAEALCRKFRSVHHTLLTEPFDSTERGERVHFASAMTLTDRADGEEGASYLDLAAVLMRLGARTTADLAQLWRRMVLFVCS